LRSARLNREWHAAHVMPKNPTREERIAWHAEHAAVCGCRPVPASIAADVRAEQRKHGLSN